MIGLMFFGLSGEITEANRTALEMLGYTQQDVVAGEVDWRKGTAPGQEAADERALHQLATEGVCTPYEKEVLRKDGTIMPVLLGAAMLIACHFA